MKTLKVKSKTIKRFSNSVGRNRFSREKWVSEVLRLAAFRYSLSDEDLETYVKNNRRKQND